MNAKVRQVVKNMLRNRTTVEFAGISRQGVSVVALSAKVGDRVYKSMGTAKWNRSDVFDEQAGLRLAEDRATVELVDLVLETDRRMTSTRLV